MSSGHHQPILNSMGENDSITSFYEDKVIFLTGGSGFLGKVIIEKLLRSCPNVKKIYVLLRSKKGRSSEERMKSLFNMEVILQVKTAKLVCTIV